MKKKELLKRVKLLGYPLFEAEETLDAGETLAAVVKCRDLRLWEGFPLLLADSFKSGALHYDFVKTHFKNSTDKSYFQSLVVMSLALYEYFNVEFQWAEELKHSKLFDRGLFSAFLKGLKTGGGLKNVRNLSAERVKTAFKRYFREESVNLEDYAALKDEFDLEYALSQVFSKKQKELFKKRLKREKMTKTEREYYSRSVKKKVLALANPELHKLAAKLAKG